MRGKEDYQCVDGFLFSFFAVDSYSTEEYPSGWSPWHNFLDDSKRRSERADKMEKPAAQNFKARIATDIFWNEEAGWSRSDFPLHANAAATHIVELILRRLSKKGANHSNWHDRYSTEFWQLWWQRGGFHRHRALERPFEHHFRAHNSSPGIIATSSSSCCVWSSGRGRRRGRRRQRYRCLRRWQRSQSWFVRG